MTDYDAAAAAFDAPDDGPQPGPVPEWVAEQTPYPAARFPYTDEDGELLFTVHRDTHKNFRQQAADGSWSISGVRLVLYGLPELRKGIVEGRPVHVTEGEKDAHALQLEGHIATTAPGGAKAKWRPEYSESLKGAAEVIVWQDKDEPGREHAAKVVKSLKEHGIPCRTVEARTGKDAWDHLAAGWRAEDTVPVAEGPTRLEEMRAKLLDRKALKAIPKPKYLVEDFIRERSSSRTNGDPGSGKSLLVLDWCGCIGAGIEWNGHATKKGTVIYVVAEGVDTFDWRVTAWEKHYGREMEGVFFYPEPIQILGREFGDLAQSEEWRTFRALCAELKPDLVVLDTQRRVTLAADENGNSDLQKAVAALDDLKRECGAAWHLVHHTPKNGSGGSGGGALWGSVDSEFETTKKGKGLDAKFFLEDTKQKSGVDGTKLEFRLRQYDVTDETADGFDPMSDRETSVVLVPVEDADRAAKDEVDTSVPEGTPVKDKIWTVLWRVYREQTFTRAEAKSLMAKEGVQQKTFLNKFGELRKEALVVEVSASRFRMRAYFREPLGSLPGDPTVAEIAAMRATPGPAGDPATSLGTP